MTVVSGVIYSSPAPSGYILELDDGEQHTLRWASLRYGSANVLWSELEPLMGGNGIMVYRLSEPSAWAYMDALAGEDGHQIVPPCIGGRLEKKLIRLHEEIV